MITFAFVCAVENKQKIYLKFLSLIQQVIVFKILLIPISKKIHCFIYFSLDEIHEFIFNILDPKKQR